LTVFPTRTPVLVPDLVLIVLGLWETMQASWARSSVVAVVLAIENHMAALLSTTHSHHSSK